ncbi:MAG: hypothetical protein IJ600_03195 [Lachnospiraceae bacterium]|nr:hypothetical protein [Lachnospiraceae bacterium]
MDIKAKVEEIVNKVKNDPALLESFQKEPVKTVERIAGVDIPDGVENQLVSGVKAALTGDKLAGAADALKKLF